MAKWQFHGKLEMIWQSGNRMAMRQGDSKVANWKWDGKVAIGWDGMAIGWQCVNGMANNSAISKKFS